MILDNIDTCKLTAVCQDVYGEAKSEQIGRFEELVKVHKDVFNTTDVEFFSSPGAHRNLSETTPTTTAARCFARQ